METNFLTQVHIDKDTTTLVARGELDMATDPEFSDALGRALDSGSQFIVVDLSALEFIDSTGVRALLRGHERATKRGLRFAIINGAPQVQRILDLTGVARHITVADSPAELVDEP